jgi:hypothetical protein
MMVRRILVSAALLGLSSTMGLAANHERTKAEEDACRPDVRKFCHHLKDASDDAYLQCFELNRDDLSKPCSDLLKSYGK